MRSVEKMNIPSFLIFRNVIHLRKLFGNDNFIKYEKSFCT